MPTATKAGGVRVRGACAAGHVTETVADKGRLTWNGPCEHEGCDLHVRCKRTPKDEVPPPPAPDHDDGGGTRTAVIEEWDDNGDGGIGEPGGLDVEQAPEREAEVEDDGEPAGGTPDPLDDDGKHRNPAHRWYGRHKRSAARSAGRREWRHPLGI